jgi:ribosomal protein S18
VDYKDVSLLRRFMNDRGRIKARGATGTCAQHQRDVAVAIKTARELALLPYAVRASGTETRGGRGGDRRGNGPPVTVGETPEQAESASSPEVTPQVGEWQSAVDQVPDSPVAASV